MNTINSTSGYYLPYNQSQNSSATLIQSAASLSDLEKELFSNNDSSSAYTLELSPAALSLLSKTGNNSSAAFLNSLGNGTSQLYSGNNSGDIINELVSA